MTILGRILPDGGNNAALPFADAGDIPDWAVDGVEKLYSLGIVNGYSDNTVLPLDNISRAEAAVMLYNIDNK